MNGEMSYAYLVSVANLGRRRSPEKYMQRCGICAGMYFKRVEM
jgi:hypothetical protein